MSDRWPMNPMPKLWVTITPNHPNEPKYITPKRGVGEPGDANHRLCTHDFELEIKPFLPFVLRCTSTSRSPRRAAPRYRGTREERVEGTDGRESGGLGGHRGHCRENPNKVTLIRGNTIRAITVARLTTHSSLSRFFFSFFKKAFF